MEKFAPRSNSKFVPKFVRNSHKKSFGKKVFSTSIPGTSATSSRPARPAGSAFKPFNKAGGSFKPYNKDKAPFKAENKEATSFKPTNFKSGPKKFGRQPRPARIKTKAPGPSPIPAADPYAFPMRINKYLAFKGFATRRGADELITKRRVTINGSYAVLGDRVEESDVVEVNNHKKIESYVYYAYNKPSGISTDETRKGTPSIAQSISLRGVFSVGHLDTKANGLMILTNDRRVSSRLFNNGHEHDAEYVIRSITPFRNNFKEKMAEGVHIGGHVVARASVKIEDPHLCSLITTDAGNHIRQMCATLFAEIEQLTRTRILNIKLDRLQSNAFRKIEDDELKEFLEALGLQ